MNRLLAIATLAGSLIMAATNMAAAQYEPFVGQLAVFSYTWGCPQNWQPANGQLLPINNNQALFSLIGTAYGGNGTTNFQLPDLRGRTAISAGQGPGLPGYTLGGQVGAPTVTITAANVAARAIFPNTTISATGSATLTAANLPQHTHQLYGSSVAGGINSPNGALSPTFPAASKFYAPSGSAADVPYATTAIGNAGQATPAPVPISVPVTIPQTNVAVSVGGGTPLLTQSPSLTLTWCIATQGIYPQRP